MAGMNRSYPGGQRRRVQILPSVTGGIVGGFEQHTGRTGAASSSDPFDPELDADDRVLPERRLSPSPARFVTNPPARTCSQGSYL